MTDTSSFSFGQPTSSSSNGQLSSSSSYTGFFSSTGTTTTYIQPEPVVTTVITQTFNTGDNNHGSFTVTDGTTPYVPTTETVSTIIQTGSTAVINNSTGTYEPTTNTPPLSFIEGANNSNDNTVYITHDFGTGQQTTSNTSSCGCYDTEEINVTINPCDFTGLGSNAVENLGTNGDDEILGSIANDTLAGGAGDDVIYGGNGHDVITVENGNNFIIGGTGDDEINIKGGNNTVECCDGDDTILFEGGNNTISLGSGDDLIIITEIEGALTFTDFTVGQDSITIRGNADYDFTGDMQTTYNEESDQTEFYISSFSDNDTLTITVNGNNEWSDLL